MEFLNDHPGESVAQLSTHELLTVLNDSRVQETIVENLPVVDKAKTGLHVDRLRIGRPGRSKVIYPHPAGAHAGIVEYPFLDDPAAFGKMSVLLLCQHSGTPDNSGLCLKNCLRPETLFAGRGQVRAAVSITQPLKIRILGYVRLAGVGLNDI